MSQAQSNNTRARKCLVTAHYKVGASTKKQNGYVSVLILYVGMLFLF